MGFTFYKPIIDNETAVYRTDGLIEDIQMQVTASEVYMGDEKVYPYVPFSSSGKIAWWRSDENVTTSGDNFVEWDTYDSNQGTPPQLTGSSAFQQLYNDEWAPGGLPEGGAHKAVFGTNYIYSDLDNIFTSTDDVTLVVAGGLFRPTSLTFKEQTWFGLTGSLDMIFGFSVDDINDTNFTLNGSQWFGWGVATPVLTAISYNGTTGTFSYFQDLDNNTIITGSLAGTPGLLGSTQELRIGGWDGTINNLSNTFDVHVLDYIPSYSELKTYGALCANNLSQTYSS